MTPYSSDQEKAATARSRASTFTVPTNPTPRLRALEKYQLFLLAWDVLCNLTVDCSSSNPLTVLILFVLQCIPLCINVVLCGVSAANYALQYGVDRKLIIRYHEVNLGSMLTYIILTFWWYIWTVRRLWPSVGDHFNFSSSDYYSSNGTKFTGDGGNLEWDELTGSAPREFYTLWSPGFIALYTIQRTVAVIYYVVGIKSVYVLVSEPEVELPSDLRGDGEHVEENLPDTYASSKGAVDSDPESVIFGYEYDRPHLPRPRGITTISELMSHTVNQNPNVLDGGGGRLTSSERSRSRQSSGTGTIASTHSRQRQSYTRALPELSSRPVHVETRNHDSPSRSHQRLRFENQSSLDETSGSVSQQKDSSARRRLDSKY